MRKWLTGPWPLIILVFSFCIFSMLRVGVAGGPTQPEPYEAPGGFIFNPAPAKVSVYRDTLLIEQITPADTLGRWVDLGEDGVLVIYADPEIEDLGIGIYEYWLRGHYGKSARSPYRSTTKEPQPEAVLSITKDKICVRRAGTERCIEVKKRHTN